MASGLSRGMKLFLAIDAVLVVAVAVVAILVLGGGGDDTAGDAPGGPASSAPATATPGTDREPDDVATSEAARSFASPTGNISCTMSPDGVTCSIANITYEPPAVPDCTGSTGHVIVLNTTDGVTTPCVDGPDPVAASADTPVLEYGRGQSVGPYTCTSASNGMTCVVEDTGVGFRVATAELVTLP